MLDDGSLPAFDHIRVLARVRSDALSDLYRAEQSQLGRHVLVKALRHGVLPSSPFATTIEREARLLSELDDEHILRLYDFQRRDDRMWLVLEDPAGPFLDDWMREHGRLPARAAAAIGIALASALAHAHGRGVVHRDLQPRNVFLSRNGQVKLFGFSLAAGQRLPTAPELLDGSATFDTPHYMAPEQILGDAPDPRSDLFSLGVMLYEMVAGQRPFDAPDSRAVTQRIRHETPAPLTRIVPDVPRTFERVVHRALQKLPSDRFYDARELGAALAAVLGDASPVAILEELLGSPSPGPARLAAVPRPAGRADPALVPGLAACLALLLVGGAGIQYNAARRSGATVTDGSRLELVPPEAAYLRVVAEPWAQVVVDGQRVETTPFARAIPLAPGTHFIRLEHPNSPTEHRTVNVAAGETVLLDVKMDVPQPATSAQSRPLPVTGEPDTP